MTDLLALRQQAELILQGLGVELLEVRQVVDHGRSVIRIVIDREGGIKVGDCELVSRELGTPLDVAGLIPDRTFLEVSSPGLNRPLVKEADFQRFAGQKVWIRTRDPIDGRRNFKGTLQGIEQQQISVLIDGQAFQVPYREIDRAQLVYEGEKR